MAVTAGVLRDHWLAAHQGGQCLPGAWSASCLALRIDMARNPCHSLVLLQVWHPGHIPPEFLAHPRAVLTPGVVAYQLGLLYALLR